MIFSGVFHIRNLSKKRFGFLTFFSTGLPIMHSFCPQERLQEISLPEEVLSVFDQIRKLGKMFSDFWKKIFQNGSKSCILSSRWRFPEKKEKINQCFLECLLKSFQQFRYYCILLVDGWEPFKGKLFHFDKNPCCLYSILGLRTKQPSFPWRKLFSRMLVKIAYYVFKGNIRGKYFVNYFVRPKFWD